MKNAETSYGLDKMKPSEIEAVSAVIMQVFSELRAELGPLPERQHVINEFEAAEYLGMSVHALRKWRSSEYVCRGADVPPCLRIGRAVRYRLSDLEEWARGHVVHPRLGRRKQND